MANGKQTVLSGWLGSYLQEMGPAQRTATRAISRTASRRPPTERGSASATSFRTFSSKFRTKNHRSQFASVQHRLEKKNCQQSNKFFLFTFLVKYLFHTWQWFFFLQMGSKNSWVKNSQVADFCGEIFVTGISAHRFLRKLSAFHTFTHWVSSI